MILTLIITNELVLISFHTLIIKVTRMTEKITLYNATGNVSVFMSQMKTKALDNIILVLFIEKGVRTIVEPSLNLIYFTGVIFF